MENNCKKKPVKMTHTVTYHWDDGTRDQVRYEATMVMGRKIIIKRDRRYSCEATLTEMYSAIRKASGRFFGMSAR